MHSKRKMCLLTIVTILFLACSKEHFIKDPGNLVPLTADQDRGIPAITVNGALLHSEAFGDPDSTLIVCIHGGPGSDYRYMLNCRDLANNGYRVVFYDQRGSGLSQRFPKKSYTSKGTGALDTLYDELSGVIAHYRTSAKQKVFLLGHSWGAILATAYAGKHPNDIQGLVVCEPGGLQWNDITSYVKASRSFKLWSEQLNDATYIDQFITGKEDQHEILDYKLAMLSGRNEISGEYNLEPGSYWRPGAVINNALFDIGEKYNPDLSAGINQFKLPVLFLYTDKNLAYPDTWAQKIASAYPSPFLYKVQGTGHSGMMTDKKIWTEKTLPQIAAYFSKR